MVVMNTVTAMLHGDNSEDPIRVCDLINLKNTSVICYQLNLIS